MTPFLEINYLTSFASALRMNALKNVFSKAFLEEGARRERIASIMNEVKDLYDRIRSILAEGSGDSKLRVKEEGFKLTQILGRLHIEELYLGVDRDEKIAKRLYKDLASILVCDPIKKSAEGETKVYFVRYKKKDFVLKWVLPEELAAQEIYSKSLTLLGDPFLKLPHSKLIKNDEYDSSAIPSEFFPEALSEYREDVSLMAFENVPGTTLLDFIDEGKYELLSEKQRAGLICRLGKVASLDFVLANPDRLVKGDLRCSNLKNLMINIEEGDEQATLFLIDNETHPLSKDELKEMPSQEFLRRLITQVSEASSPDSLVLPEGVRENRRSFVADFQKKREFLVEGCQGAFQILL